MIERYQHSVVAEILSEKAKYHRWAEIELAVMESQIEYKIVPHRPYSVVRWEDFHERVCQQEQTTRHDVVAFLQVLSQEMFGHPQWKDEPLHLGLTSSDLVDTGWAMAWKRLAETFIGLLGGLDMILKVLMHSEDGQLWIEGRTHGEVAAPVQWSDRIGRWRGLCVRSRHMIQETLRRNPGKLSGPVGAYSDWLPEQIAKDTLTKLKVSWVKSSQIVPRDYRTEQARAMLRAIEVVEQIATDVRVAVLVDDLKLLRPDGTEGSSSMPHKVNPVELEQLCGLARVARGHVNSLSESAVSWLERDITASSVDRIAMADLAHLTAYSVMKIARILDTEVKLWGEVDRHDLDGEASDFEGTCAERHHALWGV